jgi:hypothetical protein
MKAILFNVYKVFYIYFNREWYEKLPEKKPGFMGRFAACAGVAMVLNLTLLNISLFFSVMSGGVILNQDKSLVWMILLLSVFLSYFLLFNVLGLEDRNYLEPQHKPDSNTIRQTWTGIVLNLLLTFILGATNIMISKGVI